MSAQHTPGPWFVAHLPDGQGSWVACDPDGCGIHADGSYMAVCVSPIGEANARLIAAAPDLLAALEGLFRLLDAGSLYEPQAFAARAAIAKAKGGDA